MPRPAVLSRWAVAVLLALAIPFVPLPHVLVAAAVLALQLGIPRANTAQRLAIVSISVLGLPFVGDAVSAGRVEVAGLVIVGFPWLLETIREVGATHPGLELVRPGLIGRNPTSLLAALVVGYAAAALAALIVGHFTLALAALGLLLFPGALAAVSLIRLRPHLLSIEPGSARVLAGESCEVGAIIDGNVRVRGRITVALDVPWAHVVPDAAAVRAAVEVGPEPRTLSLTATPPLAGSGAVTARLTWIDPWGVTGAVIARPVAHLRVIPRAAYAAWLAHRYLETSREAGAAAVVIQEARQQGGVRRGLDYYGARHYEAGDSLRDIIWKQTAKADQLVVKDRRDDLAQAGILAVRLTGRDPDEADRLAYHLLMTTLTLAQEGIPVAFAAYAPDGPQNPTPMLAPRPAVQHALRLAEQVRVVSEPRRLLGPANPLRLRRTLSRLAQAESTPARRLADILSFELRAHRSRARRHPASRALSTVMARLRSPAVIVVISGVADDAEVLNFTLEGLGARGFERLDVLAVSS